jgi:acetoin utilization deacetylase AcuC-like enzyme
VSIAFITHPACLLHEMGEGHPERPERLSAIEDKLIASRLDHLVVRAEAPAATREQLLRVHDASYLEAIERASPRSGLVQIDPDTAMNPHTLEAALRAAGAAVLGTDLVIGGKAEAAFCAVRPPGHHAERARAMGLVSIFQHPLDPGSGIEGRSERMVNIPLAAGSSGKEFRAAVTEEWLPALERFAPQMLFVSAGFDAHRDDEMAMLRLVEADYAWVTQQLRSVAARHAQGRIVSLLEGGYELGALSRSVAAHLENLID